MLVTQHNTSSFDESVEELTAMIHSTVFPPAITNYELRLPVNDTAHTYLEEEVEMFLNSPNVNVAAVNNSIAGAGDTEILTARQIMTKIFSIENVLKILQEGQKAKLVVPTNPCRVHAQSAQSKRRQILPSEMYVPTWCPNCETMVPLPLAPGSYMSNLGHGKAKDGKDRRACVNTKKRRTGLMQ